MARETITPGRRNYGDFLIDLPLAFAVNFHLMHAPYTKVEESFGMQAAHDALRYGRELGNYDHKQFPGSVPRSFLGPLVAAGIASPTLLVETSPLILMYAVRFSIGLLCVSAHARLRYTITRVLGKDEAYFFVAIAVLQFHLPFYMSRALPNTFALALCLLAHSCAIEGSGYAALSILGFAAATVRCDILVLIAPFGLALLAIGQISFGRAAFLTASSACVGAILSMGVDSIMWGRLLWPELEVLLFNTAENRSNEWGTSPPLWYFYSALPRSLMGALPLALLGGVLERRIRMFLLVGLAFVALYSVLPHKELRFLFPVFPLLNVSAAAGAARCWRMKGPRGVLARLSLAGLGVVSAVGVAVMTSASSANYPGGVAMAVLHASEPVSPPLRVHIGNLAATSGVSRFLELNPGWEYSKEEQLEPADFRSRNFDRLLSEWAKVPGFICKGVVAGFDRVALHHDGANVGILRQLPFPRIVKSPKVYILARSPAGKTKPCGDDDVPYD